MSLPTLNDVHFVDPVLQNMLVGFANQAQDFVALDVFPGVSVDSFKGTYPIFTKKYWFMDGLERRAPGGDFAAGGIGVSSTTYETQQWAKSFPLPDEIEAGNQSGYSLMRAGTRWLAQQSFIRKERAFAAGAMVTGKWTTTNTTATDWDDASGVPVTDILSAKRTVRGLTGLSPNTLVLGEIVYDALLLNAQVAAKLQYTTQMTISEVERLLGAVLGVGSIHVSRAVYNTANEGQTASLSPVIDDDALLVYNDASALEEFDTTGAKFLLWNPGGGAGAQSQYRDDGRDTNVIKHKEQWALEIIAADLGHLWTDIV